MPNFRKWPWIARFAYCFVVGAVISMLIVWGWNGFSVVGMEELLLRDLVFVTLIAAIFSRGRDEATAGAKED